MTASKLISACILSWQHLPGNSDCASRLGRLGEYLVELASMKAKDFEEFARLQLWEFESRHISRLEEELQAHKEPPDYWVADLESYLSALREAMNSSNYVIPHDVFAGRSKDEARRLSQLLVLRFGQLLQVWPDMFETAKQLRSAGPRMAQRI